MLIDDRLGDARFRRNFLDRGPVQAALGEQAAADIE
jgi:hypothetical protein